MHSPVIHVIYPPSSRMKIECRVYATQRDMLVAIRKDGAKGSMSGVANNTMAYCCTYKDLIPAGHAAIIYFSKPHLTRGNVAHEMTHAGFSVLARRKIKSVECTTESAGKNEEALCYLVGDLVDRFYKRFGIH